MNTQQQIDRCSVLLQILRLMKDTEPQIGLLGNCRINTETATEAELNACIRHYTEIFRGVVGFVDEKQTERQERERLVRCVVDHVDEIVHKWFNEWMIKSQSSN